MSGEDNNSVVQKAFAQMFLKVLAIMHDTSDKKHRSSEYSLILHFQSKAGYKLPTWFFQFNAWKKYTDLSNIHPSHDQMIIIIPKFEQRGIIERRTEYNMQKTLINDNLLNKSDKVSC